MPKISRSRWVALYVLCVGMLMIVLDLTVVNVALPAIQDELKFTSSSLAWVVNAYMIAFGGLLLLSGRLGDLVGRRNIFLVGLAVFTAASFLCGIAQTQWMLVGARKLVLRFGARRTLIAGLTLFLAGMVVFAQAPVNGQYLVHVLPVMIFLGTGGGLSFPALMNLAMRGASHSDAGLAGGLINTTAQVGGSLGLAVLATLAAARTEALGKADRPMAEALTGGYHLAFWIGAALIAVTIAIAMTVMPRDPAAAQEPVGEGEPHHLTGVH